MRGSVQSLIRELENTPSEILEKWNRAGSLEIPGLLSLISSPKDTTEENLENPPPEAVDDLVLSPEDLEIGYTNLFEDKIALSILHDGSNQDNLLKIISESYPVNNVWVITTEELVEKVQKLTCGLRKIEIFSFPTLPNLTPQYGLIKKDEIPTSYAGSSGDIYSILSERKTLNSFITAGGDYIVLTESRCKTPPILPLISFHIKACTSVTAAVEKKLLDLPLLCSQNGSIVLVEPHNINSEENFSISSSGTYVLPARLRSEEIPWEWNRIRNIVDESLVVQYKRYISQLTRLLPTRYVKLPQKYSK